MTVAYQPRVPHGRTVADTCTVGRIPPAAEPAATGEPDYSDAYEVRLAQPDGHTAEEWVRAALDHSPRVQQLIRFVHARVLRFEVSTEPGSLLGWRTLSSTPESFHITTGGPLLRAEIVARRRSATAATLTTSLFYRSRHAALLWAVVGPLHRRVAPYLLRRAAAHLIKAGAAAG